MSDIASELRREFGSEVAFRANEKGRVTYSAPCRKCQNIWTFEFSQRVPPVEAAKKARRDGWDTGKKLVCPDCQQKEHVKMEPKVTLVEVSDQARRAQREAFDLIGADYDVDAKRYRGKTTDKIIADTCKLSEKVVADLRERLFGPLSEPSEIEEIRKEMAKVHADAEAALRSLEASQKLLASRLESLISANGWKSVAKAS